MGMGMGVGRGGTGLGRGAAGARVQYLIKTHRVMLEGEVGEDDEATEAEGERQDGPEGYGLVEEETEATAEQEAQKGEEKVNGREEGP